MCRLRVLFTSLCAVYFTNDYISLDLAGLGLGLGLAPGSREDESARSELSGHCEPIN